MAILDNLVPGEVFSFFEEICNIPHPSYKEKQISDFCVKFAKDRGLWVSQDDLYNVIIIKEASKGYEDVEPIIIQGHLDMVCQKDADCLIDLDNEPIQLEVEGDLIKAKGTTLGGDDGIAVAYALAILDSKTINHPRLEVIFTVSEEVGMDGATGIDVSMLKGKRLLNIDSEEEGIFLTSCAGGATATCILPVKNLDEVGGEVLSIIIDGLLGGHSGVEIHKKRANSNKLMGNILKDLISNNIRVNIIELMGGLKDNVITSESKCTIFVDDKKNAIDIINNSFSRLKLVYKDTDPNISVTVTELDIMSVGGRVFDTESSNNAINMLFDVPNGIIKMSNDIEGLVQTSLNLGILKVEDDEVKMSFSVRSSVETEKDDLLNRLSEICSKYNAKSELKGYYPAWEYLPDSKLRELMIDVYERMYSKSPKIEAVHAGLECGILSNKIEGLDCVSFGPNIFDIHSTKERLSISSTKRVWEFIVEVLNDTNKIR